MVTLTIISRKTHQFHVCALVVAGEPLGLIWGFSPSFHSLFSEGNAHLLSSGKKIHVFLKKPLQYFSEAKPLEKLSCIFFFLFQFLITLPLCTLRNEILQKIFARFSGGKAADHRVITSNYSRIGTKHCTNIVTFKQLTWGPETQLEFRQLTLGKSYCYLLLLNLLRYANLSQIEKIPFLYMPGNIVVFVCFSSL